LARRLFSVARHSDLMRAARSSRTRAGIDAEDAVADLLDAEGYTVAMHGFEGEGFEDQHFEGSLDEIAGFAGHGGAPLDCLEV
jgi:hypothetical protein